MYNPSVAGSQQWDTFPRERRDDLPLLQSMAYFGILVEVLSTPLTELRQLIVITINTVKGVSFIKCCYPLQE